MNRGEKYEKLNRMNKEPMVDNCNYRSLQKPKIKRRSILGICND
jgi:hypothetical protein